MTEIKSWNLVTNINNLQNINVIKILVAVMWLLYQDEMTDGQTNRYDQLAVCHLKLIVENVLRIIVTLATVPMQHNYVVC